MRSNKSYFKPQEINRKQKGAFSQLAKNNILSSISDGKVDPKLICKSEVRINGYTCSYCNFKATTKQVKKNQKISIQKGPFKE